MVVPFAPDGINDLKLGQIWGFRGFAEPPTLKYMDLVSECHFQGAQF